MFTDLKKKLLTLLFFIKKDILETSRDDRSHSRVGLRTGDSRIDPLLVFSGSSDTSLVLVLSLLLLLTLRLNCYSKLGLPYTSGSRWNQTTLGKEGWTFISWTKSRSKNRVVYGTYETNKRYGREVRNSVPWPLFPSFSLKVWFRHTSREQEWEGVTPGPVFGQTWDKDVGVWVSCRGSTT